jgi:hypothetical protein
MIEAIKLLFPAQRFALKLNPDIFLSAFGGEIRHKRIKPRQTYGGQVSVLQFL